MGRLEFKDSHFKNPASKAVVMAFLVQNPDQRLGGGPGDVEDVKRHAWYSGLDFNALLRKQIEVPFKPDVKSAGDVKYFDKEFLNQPVVNSEVQGAKDVKNFEGFTMAAK